MTASPSTASVGQQVTVEVVVHAAPANPVDAVQVYLDFDPGVLEVVSVTGGTTLSDKLDSDFDNGLGQFDYAAGNLGDSINAPFTLVTVTFRSIAVTGPAGTSIEFAPLVPPRHTKVAVGPGKTVTGNLVPVNLVVQ